MSKSADTSNWRKGAAIEIGDVVELRDDDYNRQFLPVERIELQNRTYSFYAADERYHTAALGHEFLRGQY